MISIRLALNSAKCRKRDDGSIRIIVFNLLAFRLAKATAEERSKSIGSI